MAPVRRPLDRRRARSTADAATEETETEGANARAVAAVVDIVAVRPSVRRRASVELHCEDVKKVGAGDSVMGHTPPNKAYESRILV